MVVTLEVAEEVVAVEAAAVATDAKNKTQQQLNIQVFSVFDYCFV